MPSPTLRSLLERAATDAAFRAQLLSNPALAEGLTRAQITALLAEMGLLEGQLTDEMLDRVAGGYSMTQKAGIFDKGPVVEGCGANHNESGLCVYPS